MASRVISAILTLKDKDFTSGLKKASTKLDDVGRSMKSLENQINNSYKSIDSAFTNIGKSAAALAGGALLGLGAATANAFYEMDSAFSKLQAQTGAMGSDLESLQDAATDVFKRGYGDSIGEVSDAIARVKQNIKGISPDEIEDVTANALLMAKSFDTDVNEVTRGVNNLVENFGISADKAFDMFTAGGQRGMNMSNEMFNNVAEYSGLFETMGYSAEEYFGILERGASKGVYNLDQVNDVVKEFQIRIKDGSKTTSDAMELMSKDTQSVWDQFLKGEGTVKDVASTVIDELKTMEDQTKAGQIAVELFGTQWENLESDAVYAMLGTTAEMKNFEGAAQQAADVAENSFSNRIKGAFRDATMGIAELGNTTQGKELLDWMATSAEKLVPLLVEIGQKALDFATFIKDNWGTIKEIIIPLIATLTTLKLGFMALNVITTVTGWINKMKGAVTVAGGALKLLFGIMRANPIGAVITIVGLLVGAIVSLYRNSETFRNIWDTVWNGVKRAAATAVNGVIEEINRLINVINKIPGVNIPIIPKVNWGSVQMPAQDGKKYNATTMINSGPQLAASYDVGSNYIERDQIAQIHKGEMIIPARQAENVRRQGGNIHNIDKQRGGGGVVINMTVNANQLSYNDVVHRLSRDLKLALANM